MFVILADYCAEQPELSEVGSGLDEGITSREIAELMKTGVPFRICSTITGRVGYEGRMSPGDDICDLRTVNDEWISPYDEFRAVEQLINSRWVNIG